LDYLPVFGNGCGDNVVLVKLSDRGRRARKWAVTALLCAVICSVPTRGGAGEGTLPISKQIDLLAKLASYDRNFVARAGDRVRIVILIKPHDSDSLRAAEQMKASFTQVDRIAGLPHEVELMAYPGAAELARHCRERRLSIVMVGPSFQDEVPSMRSALDGVDVLSVASLASYVPAGIVLGFDLEGGRPKVLLHLKQAKRQHVDFQAKVLTLMRIYR
jgi:hypothetical protein